MSSIYFLKKINNEEKKKQFISKSFFGIIVPLGIGLYIAATFIKLYIYYGHFGIDVREFFYIDDYLSSSIDIAILVMVTLFLIFTLERFGLGIFSYKELSLKKSLCRLLSGNPLWFVSIYILASVVTIWIFAKLSISIGVTIIVLLIYMVISVVMFWRAFDLLVVVATLLIYFSLVGVSDLVGYSLLVTVVVSATGILIFAFRLQKIKLPKREPIKINNVFSALFVLPLLLVFVFYSAEFDAAQIKRQDRNMVFVCSNEKEKMLDGMMLLGVNSHYHFLYEKKTKDSIVLANDHVLSQVFGSSENGFFKNIPANDSSGGSKSNGAERLIIIDCSALPPAYLKFLKKRDRI